ncbi:MAG: SMC-Scp complex subunit ScpB, partial [Phycisphaerales bacterium]|nr:SMC-Scp complex subunit ScpB [Phycisphaerales bacterium]
IAYRQPITRAELETIRGVGCGEVVRSLLEKRLIAIVGRAEELGRPMLYGTSRRFLEIFGLGSLRDLPAVADVLPPQVIPSPGEEDEAEQDTAEVHVRPTGQASPGAASSETTESPR